MFCIRACAYVYIHKYISTYVPTHVYTYIDIHKYAWCVSLICKTTLALTLFLSFFLFLSFSIFFSFETFFSLQISAFARAIIRIFSYIKRTVRIQGLYGFLSFFFFVFLNIFPYYTFLRQIYVYRIYRILYTRYFKRIFNNTQQWYDMTQYARIFVV